MATENRYKSPPPPHTGLLIPRENPEGTFITPALDKFYRTSEKMMGRFSAIRFDQIQRELVTEPEVQAVRWGMLIESHNPVYTAELLNYLGPDHEMAAFTVIWSYEELMHYAKLRSYLVEGGFVDTQDLDRELIETRAGSWGDEYRGYSPLQNYTYATLQEVATARFNRAWGNHAQEPVLKEVFASIGKDETRHSQWYLGKAQAELVGNPRGLDEVDQVFLEFDMPGQTFVKGMAEYKAAMQSYGAIGLEDVIAVVGKAAEIVGLPHALKLAGSSVFRQKITGEYGVDTKQVMQHFLFRRGNTQPAS